MLLQKTLHMSQALAECKARLSSIQSYRRHFVMVTKATVTSSKTVDFSFRGPLGFEAKTVLLASESDNPNQFAFESTGGNIDLMGLVDFEEIRPNCTEVTLAVHYEIKNKLFAWLDRRFHFVDAFLTSEMRSIRAHFEGVAAPVAERPALFPSLETATA
jgi:ribosome-associated toxin RatA of RatAB toxin-antitoxin module